MGRIFGRYLLKSTFMQTKKTIANQTEATLTVQASQAELAAIKDHTLGHFQAKAKIAGFREGKAPLNIVEKNIDQTALQNEFLEEAINQLYPQAVQAEGLRPVGNPEIALKKFVPFSTLEFEAKVAVVPDIKLPDYKKIKLERKTVAVTPADITEVVQSLQLRLAEKKDVDRAAKDGDEAWIDFRGVNDKGELVKGAEGTNYPLALGSKAFIPGFEENLIGLKAGDEKTFTLKFPKDYAATALANKNVTFTVTVTKVQEVVKPKADDDFAAKAGPFKTMKELKDDIKKQLSVERQRQSDLDYEGELIKKISDKTKVIVPQVLIDDQVERMLQDLKQNLTYRGQTFQEFLESEKTTEDAYKQDTLAPHAEERIKASLVLAEIAEAEKLEVTPEELEIRMQTLKGQYQDPQMQAELEKPEARRDIAARMLSEKTVALLAGYASD